MKLKCVSLYRREDVRYEPGAIFDIRDDEGEYLLRDSPGSFELFAERPVKAKKNEEPPEQPAFDVGAATVEELKAFAEAEGIDLAGAEEVDDIRAAVELALEERAKAKLESEVAAGSETHLRPQRKAKSR